MLTTLQQRVARVVASLPEADGFALAGGAALVATHVVERETRDLDFFGATASDVAALADAVHAALVAEGLSVTVHISQAGFARLEVSDGDDATEVDLGVDARIRPAEPGPLGQSRRHDVNVVDGVGSLAGGFDGCGQAVRSWAWCWSPAAGPKGSGWSMAQRAR